MYLVVPVCNGRWTMFYDRDNPGGTGDFETLRELRNQNPGQICNNPIALDARLVGINTDYTRTEQTLNVNLMIGFWCVNAQQTNGRCLDYEVRFCCP